MSKLVSDKPATGEARRKGAVWIRHELVAELLSEPGLGRPTLHLTALHSGQRSRPGLQPRLADVPAPSPCRAAPDDKNAARVCIFHQLHLQFRSRRCVQLCRNLETERYDGGIGDADWRGAVS